MGWPRRTPYASTYVPLYYFHNKISSFLLRATCALLLKSLHEHHTKISLI